MNITVIGVGRLGLGLALLFESGGNNVLGVDINPNYINQLNKKTFKTKEPEYENLLKKSKNFRATTNIEEGLNFSDIIYILVPTPNNGGNRFYDHNILSNLLFKINSYKVKNKNIIIGCTIMPKYIQEIGNVLIKDCVNSRLSYNPEFVAQGDIIKGYKNADILLIGANNEKDADEIVKIHNFMINEPTYCIVTPLEAEIIKISINGYITTKISFANMISDTCDKLGANKTKVLQSIGSDSRIGNKYFNPGYSFGGPCFPRDTRALKLFIEQNNINTDLLTATTIYNNEHVNIQAKQLYELNKEKGTYLMENICYKENCKVPIIEESAKLKIAKKLVEMGLNVTIKDEKQLIHEVIKEYGNLFNYIITT